MTRVFVSVVVSSLHDATPNDHTKSVRLGFLTVYVSISKQWYKIWRLYQNHIYTMLVLLHLSRLHPKPLLRATATAGSGLQRFVLTRGLPSLQRPLRCRGLQNFCPDPRLPNMAVVTRRNVAVAGYCCDGYCRDVVTDSCLQSWLIS